ncbi:MAG: hypothetical protein ACUVUU_08790 [bacterium]
MREGEIPKSRAVGVMKPEGGKIGGCENRNGTHDVAKRPNARLLKSLVLPIFCTGSKKTILQNNIQRGSIENPCNRLALCGIYSCDEK